MLGGQTRAPTNGGKKSVANHQEAQHHTSNGVEHRRKTIHFLPITGFSLLSMTAAIDPLRVANRMLNFEAYKWAIISGNLEAVAASNGVRVLPNYKFATAPKADMIFVCASYDVQEFNDQVILRYLRNQAKRKVIIACTGMAPFILAKAGLLRNHRFTLHWENMPAFVERYPEYKVANTLFEIDGDIMTCSGGEATFDMMVTWIGMDHGPEIGSKICSQLNHERLRSSKDQQRIASLAPLAPPRLSQAVALMEGNLEEPLTGVDLARKVGCTQRQLERLFVQHCKLPPSQFYLDLRLNRARALLVESRLSVLDIALACGFGSHNNFATRFKKKYGVTPTQQRGGRTQN